MSTVTLNDTTNPSPSLNGAQQIVFIDVSENTQSLSALAASGSLGTAVLLTSVLYGPPSNQMTRTVANGSVGTARLSSARPLTFHGISGSSNQ